LVYTAGSEAHGYRIQDAMPTITLFIMSGEPLSPWNKWCLLLRQIN